MFKNSSKLIFLFTLILGTLITISSNSWLGVWIGLEINLLSFIPLIIEQNNLISTEASLKYFLIQAFASSLLLFSIILFFLFNNFLINFSFINIYELISLPLIIKRGIAPFHFWFPNVIEGINWISRLILITWQKIAPLIVISYLTNYFLFVIVIIISTIVGAIGGLNQTSLRKILAFSSINHLGWILAAMLFNEYLWLVYFLIYSFISMGLISLFNQFNLFYINQIFSNFTFSRNLKFSFLISFLSLAGLPPFLGFLPKWIVINSLTLIDQYLLTIVLIIISLVTIYFYLRICYSALMLNYSELTWNYSISFKNISYLSTTTQLFLSINRLFVVLNLIFFIY